jgi:uncharacterized protein YndB with AHSA1/START domain
LTRQTTEFVYVTFIAAPAEKVYAAITQPEVARRYWGHENVSDWVPGSTWSHVKADATRKVQITGKVVEARPPERLVITWANPDRMDEPDAHSRVTFDITPYDGMVRLTVTHDQLEAGGSMAAGISKGWPIVLSSLKSLLETGQSLDVFAKPLGVAGQA